LTISCLSSLLASSTPNLSLRQVRRVNDPPRGSELCVALVARLSCPTGEGGRPFGFASSAFTEFAVNRVDNELCDVQGRAYQVISFGRFTSFHYFNKRRTPDFISAKLFDLRLNSCTRPL
jgi:hypothetical protein